MIFQFADISTAVISAVASIMLAIVGLITYIAKAIFQYLVDRIKALEGREQGYLTGVVDSIENISGSVKTTADFIVQLAEESKYAARRRQEEERRP